MRLLYVSAWFPYPPDNGARTRAFNVLRELGKVHSVHLCTFMPSPASRRDVQRLLGFCERVTVVESDPFVRQPARAVAGYLSTRPRSVVSTFSAQMQAAVLRALDEEEFDVVIASTVYAAPYVLSADCPKVLEEQNFLSRFLWEEHENRRGAIARMRSWLTWAKSLRYETRLFRRFSAVTMVSDVDCGSVRRMMPRLPSRLEMFPNGVDLEHNAPDGTLPRANSLIHAGPLVHAVNRDAVEFLFEAIYPRIVAKCPDTSLLLTGSLDGVCMNSLSGLPPGVRLTGRVDDVRPLVRASWGSIVPLRRGGGTRTKVLETLALGTPVVSTHKGIEGLGLIPDSEALVADEPDAFAEATLRLLGDGELRRALAWRGRQRVERDCGWAAIVERFSGLLEEVRAAGPRA